MLQMGFGIQETGYFTCIFIHFTAIKLFFAGTEIDKIPHPAGQVCNPVLCGQAQAGKDHPAVRRRRKKLSILRVLFGAAVFLVAVIIFSAQPMQAAFAGICVIDLLRRNL